MLGLWCFESGRPDSNRRRPAWEAGILPTELRPRSLADHQLTPFPRPAKAGLLPPLRSRVRHKMELALHILVHRIPAPNGR